MKKYPYRRLVRHGEFLRYIEIYLHRGEEVSRTIWGLNLYIFIQIPFILLFLALTIFAIQARYDACMEIFNSFWYCALR